MNKLFTPIKGGQQLLCTLAALLLFSTMSIAQFPSEREADPYTTISQHGDFVKAVQLEEDGHSLRLKYIMADMPKDGAKSIKSYKVDAPYALEGQPLRPDQTYFIETAPTANIIVNYTGFTPEAQAAFQYAVDIWARTIVSNVDIVVDANFGNLGAGILGGASPTFQVFAGGGLFPKDNVFYPSALADKLFGADVGPLVSLPAGFADIQTSFNSTIGFGFDWYYGTDGNPAANEFDFVTVVLHELGHGLGMSASGPDTFCDGIGGAGFGVFAGTGFLPNAFDCHLEDKDGNKLVDENPNVCHGPGTVVEIIMNVEGYFGGEGALAGNGQFPVQIYTPDPIQPGSSVSHWDETAFPTGGANSLMTPFLAPAEAIHTPGTVTMGALSDMGWMIACNFEIPTMGQWALMILGLLFSSLALGFMLKTRRVNA